MTSLNNAALSNDYTASPACALVATRCACCNRELVDAESVERGMGPWCRKKHGYGAAEGYADWAGVDRALAGTPALEVIATEKVHPRLAANYLVWLVALAPEAPEAAHYVVAIYRLGYRVLAAKIAGNPRSKVRGVVVEEVGDLLVVHGAFSKSLNVALRACGVPSTFDFEAKVRRVPVAARGRLVAALQLAGKTRPRAVIGAGGARVV